MTAVGSFVAITVLYIFKLLRNCGEGKMHCTRNFEHSMPFFWLLFIVLVGGGYCFLQFSLYHFYSQKFAWSI